jgi:hypothetical protein
LENILFERAVGEDLDPLHAIFSPAHRLTPISSYLPNPTIAATTITRIVAIYTYIAINNELLQ